MAARHAATLLLHVVERRFYFIYLTIIGDFKVLVAKRHFLRTPAGCLGLLLPCSRAPPLLCLSARTPTGLKSSWRSTKSAISAWLCPFLSFSFFPSFPPLPPPLHFISHEATHPSASRYSWRRLWMCLAASHHPSRSHTDADGHRGWRPKNVSEPTDLDSKTSSYSLFGLKKMERIKRSTHLTWSLSNNEEPQGFRIANIVRHTWFVCQSKLRNNLIAAKHGDRCLNCK